jgi:hypothetical protein
VRRRNHQSKDDSKGGEITCSHRNTPAEFGKDHEDQDVSRLRPITQAATAETGTCRRDRDKIGTSFWRFGGSLLRLGDPAVPQGPAGKPLFTRRINLSQEMLAQI